MSASSYRITVQQHDSLLYALKRFTYEKRTGDPTLSDDQFYAYVATLLDPSITPNVVTTVGPGLVLDDGELTLDPAAIATNIPAPALVATANVTLSGNQTVDTVATNTLAAGSHVLCTAQANPVENGPQVVSNSGAWARPDWFDSDPEVAGSLGQPTGAVLGGSASNQGSQWFLQSGSTILGAKTYQRITPGVTLFMPAPNGVNDLPAFQARVDALASINGTIQFLNGTYRSPTGFLLTNTRGIRVCGVGTSVNGTGSTVLRYTGARTAFSSIFRMFACDSCSIEQLSVESTLTGPEYGIIIGGNGVGDSFQCYADQINCYGHSGSTVLATSATAINTSTCANVATAIVLSAQTVPYPVGTQLFLGSRSGLGTLYGEITASSGVNVTFIPRDVLGDGGTHSDWNVLQPMNGINVASSELCAITRSAATLCYSSFAMGGVGGIIDPSCATSSPLGPSFRTGSSSSYVKIFGNAEFNALYIWTTALLIDGALNVEASVGMGDGYLQGIPYVLRGIQGGKVYGLNAQGPAGGSAISVNGCSGLHIRSVFGDIASGFFVKNEGGNSSCSIDALHGQVGTMNTFTGSAGFTGFSQWYDIATAKLNLNFAKTQFLETQFGIAYTAGSMVLANGKNSNISLATGYNVITGPTGAFGVTGFAPPSDGKRTGFLYLGSQAMTIYHNDAGSTAGQRLMCATGANIVLTVAAGGFTYFEIQYSAAAGAWLVLI